MPRCSQYCKPDASFAAQAEPLADVKTLEAYTEWMKWLYTFMPDAGYEVKSWAVDGERNNVLSYAVFSERIPTRAARSRQPERASDQTMST